jgi:DNA replication protein DnaC
MTKSHTVVNELIRAHAKTLKMPGVSRSLDELLRRAEKEKWSHGDFLNEALAIEVASRNASSVRHRIVEARFPETKTLDEFDFKLADGLEQAQIAALGKGAFIDRHDNVVFVGPVGTGKTHLAIALGVEAARQRRHVAFFRAAELVRQLIEAKTAHDLGRIERRIFRIELLIIDELGYVPFERQGGELLFNLMSQRHQRRSTIVTTNLAFSEWPSAFGGDEKLTAALLDRLAETATVVTTKGKSFRMRRRAEGGKAA